MITIHHDAQTVSSEDVKTLGIGIKSIVSSVMNKSDVFVFMRDDVSVSVGEPIEVFVQVNAAKVSDPASLAQNIADALTSWKQENAFTHRLNLNVIPVEWHAKLGI